MEELITHLVSPFLSQPEELSFNLVEGKGSILVELKLHEDDRASFTDDDRFAVQHVLSLGTGKKKPVVNVVDAFTIVEEEKEDSESSSSSSDEDSNEAAANDEATEAPQEPAANDEASAEEKSAE